MQKTLSSKKWIWKRCRNDDAWAEIMQMRNSYHDAIKLIKNQFWINFLNNIEEKEVFQIYKFTKSRLIRSYSWYKTCKKNWKLNSMKSARHFWKQCTHHHWKFKSMKNYYWMKVYSDQELSKRKSSTLLTSQHSEKHSNQMICHLQSYSECTKLYWKSLI